MNHVETREKSDSLPVPQIDGTCMDCIFWYQCRRGEIDCNLRPQRSIENTIRA